MRVRWLRSALRNLDDEANYIAADDPQAAISVVARITQTVSLLATQPALGRPGRIAGTRELVIAKTPYVIPYRVRHDAIEVLRVFHTSRRAPGKW